MNLVSYSSATDLDTLKIERLRENLALRNAWVQQRDAEYKAAKVTLRTARKVLRTIREAQGSVEEQLRLQLKVARAELLAEKAKHAFQQVQEDREWMQEALDEAIYDAENPQPAFADLSSEMLNELIAKLEAA